LFRTDKEFWGAVEEICKNIEQTLDKLRRQTYCVMDLKWGKEEGKINK
jgi:hypothetical protein